MRLRRKFRSLKKYFLQQSLFFQKTRSNFVARLKITGRSKTSKAEKFTACKATPDREMRKEIKFRL